MNLNLFEFVAFYNYRSKRSESEDDGEKDNEINHEDVSNNVIEGKHKQLKLRTLKKVF